MSDDSAREKAIGALPVTDRRLDVAGIPTAMLEGGEGPPIVLVHGAGESGLHWMRVIPSLATTHRVLAPDLPAHGASGALPDGAAAQTVDWLAELIDCTCDVEPVVVGGTLGGAVAARVAAAYPDRLEGLVLVDALGLTAFTPEPRSEEVKCRWNATNSATAGAASTTAPARIAPYGLLARPATLDR